MALKVSDKDGKVKFVMKDDGTIPKYFGASKSAPTIGIGYPLYVPLEENEKPFSWGGISTYELNEFHMPTYGTLKTEDVKQGEPTIKVTVDIKLERYEKPIVEVNEDNEVIVKVGKLKVGGCK